MHWLCTGHSFSFSLYITFLSMFCHVFIPKLHNQKIRPEKSEDMHSFYSKPVETCQIIRFLSFSCQIYRILCAESSAYPVRKWSLFHLLFKIHRRRIVVGQAQKDLHIGMPVELPVHLHIHSPGNIDPLPVFKNQSFIISRNCHGIPPSIRLPPATLPRQMSSAQIINIIAQHSPWME